MLLRLLRAGLLYWTLYLVLYETTPGTFYVSEIVWISSCIFLYLLQYTLAGPAERAHRCGAMWLAPALGAAMFALYCVFAPNIPADLLRCCVMSALAWNAIRGLAFGARRRFHAAVLAFVCAEYALWASSITWLVDTLANPYFWIDFVLTGILIALLPAAERGRARDLYRERLRLHRRALVVAALCAGRRHLRIFVFSLAGMLVCLLSAYVNTFFAAILGATDLGATAEIAPVSRR